MESTRYKGVKGSGIWGGEEDELETGFDLGDGGRTRKGGDEGRKPNRARELTRSRLSLLLLYEGRCAKGLIDYVGISNGASSS